MLYLCLFVGVLLHFIAKLRDAYTANQFFDWKRHLILSAFNIPAGLVIVYFSTEYLNEFNTILIGYALDSVVKNLESYPWKKIGNY